MAEGVLGEMLYAEGKTIIGILKYENLESWELKEVQDIKEIIEGQGGGVEIEILIGKKYKYLSNVKKNYKLFISYENSDDAYVLNKEGRIVKIVVSEKNTENSHG